MQKNIIQNGSRITLSFSLIDEDKNVIFGEKEGKVETLTLDDNEPMFDLFKCLIGKEEGFSGKFKVNPQSIEEKVEDYNIDGLPSSIIFKIGTIVKFGSSNKKIGFIKQVDKNIIKIETNKPFRHVNSILSVVVKKVD